MRKSLHIFLSFFLLSIAYSSSAYNNPTDEYYEDLCLENNSYLIVDPLVVSLACPATPGFSGLESEQTTIVVAATNSDDTGSGSITFPSGIYATIPANAIDINVSLTTKLETFGDSWLEEIFISIDAPGTFADVTNNQPSTTGGGGIETYITDYGDNDPSGLWDFLIVEDLNDQGVDSEVTFTISISWTVPPAPSDCDTIICDASSFILDTDLPGLTYNWSTTETTQSITVTESGIYTVTVTDGTETAIDDITVIFGASEETMDVNLCDGDTHTVGDNTYSMTGVFTDVFESYTGCDSTIITNLTIGELETTEIYPIVCNGGSHTTGTSTYDITGDFTDVIMSSQGCDSTIITHLTVLDAIEETVDTTICFGETYTVGTMTYSMSGNFTDVLTSYQNCDSTVNTNLIILDEYEENQDITICFGESYVVGTSTYTDDGNYTDLLVSSTGCDSTILTNLTVLAENIQENTVTICFGETYEVGTNSYNTTDDYTDILNSYQNCDSTIITHLIVLEEILTEEFIQICAGEVHIVGDSTYTVLGDHTTVLESYLGCDSTVLTQLNVIPEIIFEQFESVCDGETFIVGTSTYTESGDFIDFLSSVINGCDSTVITHLTVSPLYTTSEDVTICFGETYTVGTSDYTSYGNYTDVLVSSLGCDSTVNTNLTVLAEIIEENPLTICFGETHVVGSVTYDISGDYSEVLVSSEGCDSTVITHLSILPENFTEEFIQICGGQSYEIGTNSYDMAGDYANILMSAAGCDSTVLTHLAVVLVITAELDVTICEGETYIVGTNTYDTSGDFIDTLISVSGCDSIITTHLTVAPIEEENNVHVLCFGDTLLIGNSVYTTSGSYTDNLVTFAGCDSIIHSDLTILGEIIEENTITLCFNESILIGGNIYDTSGDFTDILLSSTSCDSTIITHLTVLNEIINPINAQICLSQTYTEGTSTYDMSGIYTDVYQSIDGCDSTIITSLTVVDQIETTLDIIICPGDSYVVGTSTYNADGTYMDTLLSAGGCDSIVTINLSVYVDIPTNQDVSICFGESYSIETSTYLNSGTYTDIIPSSIGCDSTIITVLTVTGSGSYTNNVQICAGDTYIIGTSTYTNAGTYTDVLTSSLNCDSTVITTLDVVSVINTDETVLLCEGESYQGIVYETSTTLVNEEQSLSGCDSIHTITLIVSEGLEIDLIVQDDICAVNQGSIMAAVFGGIPPYTYAWNPSVNSGALLEGISAGLYEVTVTDGNGCTIVVSAVVNTSPGVTIVADVANMTCNGGKNGVIDITVATGTAPYLFIWNGPNNFSADTEDIDNLVPGNYTIIIYDANGCGFGSTIQVTEPDPLVVDMITYPGTVVASVTGGTAPYQYFWSNGSTTPSLVDVSPGNYYITIEDSNGCSTLGEAAVLFSTDVIELENFLGLNILPNPSAGRFIIDLEMSASMNLNFSIYDLNGKAVYQHSLQGMSIREEIDLTNHNSGTYLLVIGDGRNRKVEKIVIVR